MRRMELHTFRHAQHSFLFCLLLLLSICSAIDSFQQVQSLHTRRRQSHERRTILKASSIDLASLVGVYGGGRESSIAPAPTRTWKTRKQRSLDIDDAEYQQRKKEWAEKYTTLEGLRETFGSNRNKLYGDLDVPTTRKLYKSLLPTAVCELVLDVEVKPEELAQLAYEARKAAKLYARERCHVPARLLANCYDGLRSLKNYGRFQVEGMSYDQVFDKYYQRSALERALLQNETNTAKNNWWNRNHKEEDDEDDAIVTQTCMKILESACRTNPLIDRMALSDKQTRFRRKRKRSNNVEPEDLEKIAQTLEDDVRKLLDPYSTCK